MRVFAFVYVPLSQQQFPVVFHYRILIFFFIHRNLVSNDLQKQLPCSGAVLLSIFATCLSKSLRSTNYTSIFFMLPFISPIEQACATIISEFRICFIFAFPDGKGHCKFHVLSLNLWSQIQPLRFSSMAAAYYHHCTCFLISHYHSNIELFYSHHECDAFAVLSYVKNAVIGLIA